jgi:hypothetical protein
MSEKKLSKDLQEKALDRVMDFYGVASTGRKELEQKWARWDALYNKEDAGKKGKDDGMKSHPPDLRRALQVFEEFVMATLFPGNGSDTYRIDPINGDSDVKNAVVYKKIADVQDEKINYEEKIGNAVHRWGKYGQVLVRVPYILKDKYIIADEKEARGLRKKIQDFLNGKLKIWKSEDVPKKTKRVVYDNIDLQPKSPFNMFWNYNVPWDEQTIVIEKIDNVTASHLKAQHKKGIYNDNVLDVIKKLQEKQDNKQTGKVPDETDIDQKFPYLTNITGLTGNFDDGIAKTSLLQADCLFDIDQDGYDELCIITVALYDADEGEQGQISKLIGLRLNTSAIQEIPVLFCDLDPFADGDMSLGMGIIQNGSKDQHLLTSYENALMRNTDAIIDAVKIIDKNMIDEGQNLNSWRNKVLKSDGPPSEAIHYDRPPSILNDVNAITVKLRNNIQSESRAAAALQGLAARYDTTATEYTQQGSAAGRSIMRLVRKFENNIIKRYKRFQYSYNQQFIEKDTLITILGKKAAKAALKNPGYDAAVSGSHEEITPNEAIEGDYNFVPLGVSQMENKIIKSQQYLNFLNIVTKIPGFQMIINLKLFISKLWDLMGDGDDNMILPQNDDPEFDPNDENLLITQGCEVHVSPKNDDDKHIAVHSTLVIIPELAHFKIDHLKEHMVSKQKKMMAAIQAQAGQGGAQQPAQFMPKPPAVMPQAPARPPAGAM